MMQKAEKCYGKKKNCKLSCAFKPACQNLAKEEENNIRYSYFQTIPFNPAIEVQQSESDGEADRRLEETLNIIDEIDIDERDRVAIRKAICGIIDRKDDKESIQEFCRRFGRLWQEQPLNFNFLMESIFNGLNQTELARKYGVSRQYISKKLMDERRRRNVVHLRPEMLKNSMLELTYREIAVYQLMQKEGLSSRETARRLKLRQTQVMRCVQSLRRKGMVLCSNRPYDCKKKKKNFNSVARTILENLPEK